MVTTRFSPRPTFIAALIAMLAGLALAMPSQAGVEPYGEGFDGWIFTQADQDGGVNCRGKSGTNILARNTNGNAYVSIPAGKIAKGKFPESTLEIGPSAEMIDAQSFGDRLLFFVDDTVLEQIAVNRGYKWRILVAGQLRSGTVKLNNSATSALERVMECVSTNGG